MKLRYYSYITQNKHRGKHNIHCCILAVTRGNGARVWLSPHQWHLSTFLARHTNLVFFLLLHTEDYHLLVYRFGGLYYVRTYVCALYKRERGSLLLHWITGQIGSDITSGWNERNPMNGNTVDTFRRTIPDYVYNRSYRKWWYRSAIKRKPY